jgi:hypothetical protein
MKSVCYVKRSSEAIPAAGYANRGSQDCHLIAACGIGTAPDPYYREYSDRK